MYENDLVRTSNWTGIVEDIADPLMNNRLRIRINGFHNQNKTVLPTESLPWAMVGLPVNSSDSFSVPRVGDWVIGFFLDGESAQFPVVTHVLPGINTVVAKAPVGYPTLPPGEFNQVAGQPSNPPLSREVVDYTAIDKSNRRRAHVCDISYEVNQTTGALKNFFNTIVAELRIAINLVIGASNSDPTGLVKKVVEDIRSVTRLIKYINSKLRIVKNAIDTVLLVVRKVRAMIDYILSLPAKAAAFFKECLTRLYKTIAAGITSLFPDLGGDGDFKDLANAVQEGLNTLSQTVSLTASIAATPQKFGAVLLAPTSQAEAAAAGKQLTSLISDNGRPASPIEVGAGP